jgi:hypothetical protein
VSVAQYTEDDKPNLVKVYYDEVNVATALNSQKDQNVPVTGRSEMGRLE